ATRSEDGHHRSVQDAVPAVCRVLAANLHSQCIHRRCAQRYPDGDWRPSGCFYCHWGPFLTFSNEMRKLIFVNT
ncbi:hypothetical protein PENTCL1PPCAC_7475, partial [Pristionchus entomophagus]